jgi:ElaB/YqjD/DUF883 family membrane-anchored ribosome-binding protein
MTMTTVADNEEVTTDKLLKDLQTVVADAEALLKATAGQAGERIQEARARAEASLHAARERLRSVEDDALRQAREMVDEGEAYVRQNPLTAVGIAAGIGLLVGLLLGRR